MKKIPLTNGLFSIVDDDDFDNLNKYKWHSHKKRNYFYAVRMDVDRNEIAMHRVIMNPSKYQVVDHINHDTLDNRKINLRCVTHSENQRNSKLYSNNTSGVCGVTFCKRSQKWVAQYELYINGDRKNYWLGRFKNKEDAIKARISASKDNNFHENHGKAIG